MLAATRCEMLYYFTLRFASALVVLSDLEVLPQSVSSALTELGQFLKMDHTQIANQIPKLT